MGGAFIGVADDWSAIYWNPAGLAHLKKSQAGASFEYLRVITHDSDGLKNAQIPFTQANVQRGDVFSQFGGEPTQFNGQDSDFRSLLPGLGGAWVTHGVTVAGGSYAPLGFAFNVADGKDPGYSASFKSRGAIIDHNLSLAKTIFPGISIGAGINLVQASLARTSDKRAPGYESSISADAKTLDVQGVFGLLVDLGRHAHVGAVYRTGQDLSLKGHAGVSDGRFPAESSDFTRMVRNPTTYGIGISILPFDCVTISADWQRTEWNATREDTQFDQPGLLLQNQNFDPGWVSTSRYRFGAEWRLNETWSLRAGYFRDPQAVALGSQALTGIIDPDLKYYTSGISFHRARWGASLTSQTGSGKTVVAGRTLRKEVDSWVSELDYFF
jgi:long-chain fatty acid transport protein